MFKQLDEKYGTESTPTRYGSGLIRTNWNFNATMQQQCNGFSCTPAYAMTSPSGLQGYAQAVASGHNFLIMVDVHPAQQDPTRVGQIDLTVDDESNKAETLTEALKQLQTAAQAAYAKNATPQNVPKL